MVHEGSLIMNEHEQKIEQWLKSANVKQLSAEADERISAAIIAADDTHYYPLWRRRIPVWQAAAACVAISVLTLIAAGMFHRDNTREVKPSSLAPVALTRNEVEEPPPYLTDASKWKVLNISTEGRP